CSQPSPRLLSSALFCLLLPPPPLSTLFPYTTLFRSDDEPPSTVPFDGEVIRARDELFRIGIERDVVHVRESPDRDAIVHELDRRSEEHTSELQSLTNLVCRLLLEKKKQHTREH